MKYKQKDKKELFQAAKQRELMQRESQGGEHLTLSSIVSTDINSGVTCHTSNPFFRIQAKTVMGREEWRWVRGGDEMPYCNDGVAGRLRIW